MCSCDRLVAGHEDHGWARGIRQFDVRVAAGAGAGGSGCWRGDPSLARATVGTNARDGPLRIGNADHATQLARTAVGGTRDAADGRRSCAERRQGELMIACNTGRPTGTRKNKFDAPGRVDITRPATSKPGLPATRAGAPGASGEHHGPSDDAGRCWRRWLATFSRPRNVGERDMTKIRLAGSPSTPSARAGSKVTLTPVRWTDYEQLLKPRSGWGRVEAAQTGLRGRTPSQGTRAGRRPAGQRRNMIEFLGEPRGGGGGAAGAVVGAVLRPMPSRRESLGEGRRPMHAGHRKHRTRCLPGPRAVPRPCTARGHWQLFQRLFGTVASHPDGTGQARGRRGAAVGNVARPRPRALLPVR